MIKIVDFTIQYSWLVYLLLHRKVDLQRGWAYIGITLVTLCTSVKSYIYILRRYIYFPREPLNTRQIRAKNTSPYFHSVSLIIWPLTLMKRTHLSELSISRSSTYLRKAQGWTLHFRTPDPSKRSDNKWYAMEVRWGIFIENLTVFFIP